MSGFFEGLKRRKVYRVAIAYAVGSWALAQGLAQVLPVFDISNSVIRVVIALLLIGFPVALVLAWVFDVTPQEIKATPTIAAPGAHRRRNVMMLVATGVIISAAAGFFLLPRAAAHKIDKSIAVLPFENLSDEKENAYFADGIQDDILTNLSKIGDLKVISRTSVMSYRGHAPNVREIGKALGVATILEGSVRREGNRVRVNVQLINATNDEHVWANNYDRDLTDVFAIQTDLAQKIAGELQAKLSPTEKAQIESKPTQNGEAYLSYVRAHDFWSKSVEDLEKLKEGEQMYQRAVDLDPKFALAFARYSQLESWLVHSFEGTPARRQKAREFAQRALELQPDLPEAHLAAGFVNYYIDNDFEAAEKLVARINTIPKKPAIQNKIAGEYLGLLMLERRFDQAGRVAEKISDADLTTFPGALCGKYSIIGAIKRAMGDETGAREALIKAKAFAEDLVKQNPDAAQAHAQLAGILARLGEKETALATINRAQALLPETKDAFGGPEITMAAAEIHALVGDADGAIALLDGLLQRPSPVNVPVLKLDPLWDPLRKHPRFQALID